MTLTIPLKRGVIAVFLLYFISSAAPAQTPAQSASQTVNPITGPSFPCPQPDDPLAQLICATPQLSLLDMQFVQTYESLYQQVSPHGDQALHEEDVQFGLGVRSKCGIALAQSPGTTPVPPPAPEGSDTCVMSAYRQQISSWQSQLNGAAAEEANRMVQEQVALQSRLQTLGFLSSQDQLDGVFGPATRAAIIKWQTSVGRQPTGLLGNADAQALLGGVNPDVANGSPQQPPSSGSSGSSGTPMNSILGWLKNQFIPSGADGGSASTSTGQQVSSSDSIGVVMMKWQRDDQKDPLSGVVTQRVAASVGLADGINIQAIATCDDSFSNGLLNTVLQGSLDENIEFDVFHSNSPQNIKWTQSGNNYETTVEYKIDNQDTQIINPNQGDYSNAVDIGVEYSDMSTSKQFSIELNTSDGEKPVFDINPSGSVMRDFTGICWKQYQSNHEGNSNGSQ